MIQAEFDSEDESIFLRDQSLRRINLSPARPALNAYQRGRGFYCSDLISVDNEAGNISHVDHFLPFRLKAHGLKNVDSIWNLVLACQKCNLQKLGKLPHEDLAQRIATRNDWYCASKHPLSETIRLQTGATKQSRLEFLRTQYYEAASLLGTASSAGWRP